LIAVDARSRVAVITWPDVQPELDVWRTWFERVLGHPDFEPDFGIVSDRRALTVSPDATFVRGFIGVVSGVAGAGRFHGRWATVVAPRQVGVYGMGRMTEILSEPHPVEYRVFTDLDEAVAWASRPDPRPSAAPLPR
jgi:hypothetical protein